MARLFFPETIELLKDDEKTRLLKMLEEVIGMKMKTREKEKKFKLVLCCL